MRLTEYKNDTYWNYGSLFDIVNKLGQLEDLEDELGISLITLFKALNQRWIYCVYEEEIHLVHVTFEKYGNSWVISNAFGETYKLSDYGIKWALTKEELI